MAMSSDGINLDILPTEILDYILSSSLIDFRDVCRFSQVCAKFRGAANNNEVWRIKYRQRWKTFHNPNQRRVFNWKDEFQERYVCGVTIRQRISRMSSQFYNQDEMSQESFNSFLEISSHRSALFFYIDELESIIYDNHPHHNLTLKYYAQRVLRFIRHEHLKSEWKNFLSHPAGCQALEKGAILLAQWCQPLAAISEEEISAKLDEIAWQVEDLVRAEHKNHPLNKVALHPIDQPLVQSRWSPAECRAILTPLNHVIFQELKFSGNKEDYYNPENSFINKVLSNRRGIPISLSVIYAAVAHRLGVKCLPVNFPGHFLLKWHEHPDLSEEQQYTYIDVFDKGKFLRQKDCHSLMPGYQRESGSWYTVVDPVQVFCRMCWNLVEIGRQQEGLGDGFQGLRNALELLNILNPSDVEHRLLLARVYLHLNINLDQVMVMLQDIQARDPTSTGIVAYMYRSAQSQMTSLRQRQNSRKTAVKFHSKNPSVTFAIGMIMKHKKYNYMCVVYGWDSTCVANRDWIYQMGVFNLPNKDKQPFYNVLVEDGSNRYAAQENLEIAKHPHAISHTEVGKYFQHFRGTHYIPNAEKMNEYPEDTAVRDTLVQGTYGV